MKIEGIEFTQKAAALILRENEDVYELLVHSFAENPLLPWRFPSGGIESETIEEGLLREVYEESGLQDLTIVRKLGVQRYYKAYSDRFIERHDYLLKTNIDLPDTWQHLVHGNGNDAGEIFLYRWIRPKEIYRIDPEHHKFLDEKHLPEFFYAKSQ